MWRNKEKVCKRVENKVELLGFNEWKKGLESAKGKEYVSRKIAHEVVKYADGAVGTRVRILCKGGCLPVRASDCMSWKHEWEEECGCGENETMDGTCFV